MPYFIKTGYWDKARKSLKGWLNLDDLIASITSTYFYPTKIIPDGSNVSIDSKNSSFTSSQAAVNFAIPFEGDDMTLEVILNTTDATYTFPSNSYCVSEGVATGDNTLPLSGVSGDRYIIGIKKINDTYYIVSKNFGQ